MSVDKKVRDGQIQFVLPRKVGEVAITGGITVPQAVQVLADFMKQDPFRTPLPKPAKAGTVPKPTAIQPVAPKPDQQLRKRVKAAKP